MTDIIGPERSTLLTRTARATSDISSITAQIDDAQRGLTDMKRIHSPSDDPIGTSRVMAVDEQLVLASSYNNAIGDARSRMQVSDSSLSDATEILNRAKELALQANNGTLSASERANMATEIDALSQAYMQLANTRFGDDYIFSGTRSNVPAYANGALTDTYQGDKGVISRQVGAGIAVQVNVNASDAFESGRTALASLISNMQSNNQAGLSADLTALDGAHGAMLDQRTALGARMHRVEAASSSLQTQSSNLDELKSSILDLNVPEAASRLKRAEIALNASLEVNAKMMGLSIFDFIR